MPRFNSIKFYQNRPKIKLVFVKNRQNFRALGAPSPDLRKRLPPPLQTSGYAPESNHVLALLIFLPPKFSLKPDFKSINFYQNKGKLSYFCKKKIFFERWGLRTQTLNGIRRIGRSFQIPERAPPHCRFLVTRHILNV